jgi:hypothetical protein
MDMKEVVVTYFMVWAQYSRRDRIKTQNHQARQTGIEPLLDPRIFQSSPYVTDILGHPILMPPQEGRMWWWWWECMTYRKLKLGCEWKASRIFFFFFFTIFFFRFQSSAPWLLCCTIT